MAAFALDSRQAAAYIEFVTVAPKIISLGSTAFLG